MLLQQPKLTEVSTSCLLVWRKCIGTRKPSTKRWNPPPRLGARARAAVGLIDSGGRQSPRGQEVMEDAPVPLCCSKSPSHILAPGQGRLFRQRGGSTLCHLLLPPTPSGLLHKMGTMASLSIVGPGGCFHLCSVCLPCDPIII